MDNMSVTGQSKEKRKHERENKTKGREKVCINSIFIDF